MAATFGDPAATAELMAAARARRDSAFESTVTFSPKVFLPITNLCRNDCDYCSFKRRPQQAGEWTMTPAQVQATLAAGAAAGCSEALYCLGDRPEVFRNYRDLIGQWGFTSTVDYLDWAGARALEAGLVPHTNAGILDATAITRLRHTNPSLGLMLESSSMRLCAPGGPHHRAPDKRPDVRLAFHEACGQARVPLTSGILIGIGETPQERIESLLAIRATHRRWGHIQEVIVQNYRWREGIRQDNDEPSTDALSWTIAMARLILDDEVSVQAPPNLNPGAVAALIAAGVNDFGGISPVTVDYINHSYPWPNLDRLRAELMALGFTLVPRLPVYDRYLDTPGWVDPAVASACRAVRARQLQAAA